MKSWQTNKNKPNDKNSSSSGNSDENSIDKK